MYSYSFLNKMVFVYLFVYPCNTPKIHDAIFISIIVSKYCNLKNLSELAYTKSLIEITPGLLTANYRIISLFLIKNNF